MPSGTDPFENLRQATHCPFAKTACIEFAPGWDHTLGFLDNIRMHADALAKFVAVAEHNQMHGFVSEVVIGAGAREFDSVRRGFGSYLRGLGCYDEDCSHSLAGDKLDRRWQFRFSGMRMFLNVFAPCYEEPHSKFLASEDSFWVFFQPEYSFDLCGVDSSRADLKRWIRSEFSSHGMPYNGDMIDRRTEALLYMFPQRIGDTPVQWWHDPPTDDQQ